MSACACVYINFTESWCVGETSKRWSRQLIMGVRQLYRSTSHTQT